MSEPHKDRWRRGMADILGELEALFTRDEMGAVQISIALRNGDIRTLSSYDDGFRILLIAAASIGQREAIEGCQIIPSPDNWTTSK